MSKQMVKVGKNSLSNADGLSEELERINRNERKSKYAGGRPHVYYMEDEEMDNQFPMTTKIRKKKRTR